MSSSQSCVRNSATEGSELATRMRRETFPRMTSKEEWPFLRKGASSLNLYTVEDGRGAPNKSKVQKVGLSVVSVMSAAKALTRMKLMPRWTTLTRWRG